MKNKLLIIFATLLLLTALSADYLVTHHSSKSKNHTSSIAHNNDNVPAMLQEMSLGLLAKYANLHAVNADQTITIGYPISTYGFQMIMPTTMALAFTDRASQSEPIKFAYYNNALATVRSYLALARYNELPSVSSVNQSLLTEVYFYKNAKNICQVTSYTLLDVSCESRVQLQLAVGDATPLVHLYRTVVSNVGTISVMQPTYKASETPGYRLAALTVYDNAGETVVNFYQQGAGAWRMVPLTWYNDPHEDGSVTPNCQDFMSIAGASAAYKGVSCYNSSDRSMAIID
jgi:hypothetical protein